jgi:DCN1-like protein 1/2
MKFCEDLGVQPDDIVMLVISWNFQAEHMYEYKKDEFLDGMTELECDGIAKLKAKLPKLRQEVCSPDTFKEVYKYAYMFSREKGQKCVQLDTAVPMWRLLFAQNGWKLADTWCDFVETHHKHAVSKDTWNQLLDFARMLKPDLSNLTEVMENSAWPVLIDDFVDHLQSQK